MEEMIEWYLIDRALLLYGASDFLEMLAIAASPHLHRHNLLNRCLPVNVLMPQRAN